MSHQTNPGSRYKAAGGILYRDAPDGTWHPVALEEAAQLLTQMDTLNATLLMQRDSAWSRLRKAGIGLTCRGIGSTL
jgi:hypothetical protein